MNDGGTAASQQGLPLSEMKQQFSLAYLHMVATAAGCSLKDHKTDYDGVDVTVVSSVDYETCYEIQLKCTSRTDLLREEHVAWPMEAKPFQKLTNPKRFVPAYLGVLVLPGSPEAWIDQDENRLVTGSRMYWQRAADLGTIDHDAGSKIVYLPRSNLVDVPQLLSIMKYLGDGGDW